MKDFKPMKVDEILALTGQVHPPGYDYDRVLIMYVGRRTPVDMLLNVEDEDLYATPVTAAVLGLNFNEKRVVDVAVHPNYRRLGFGEAIVKLAVKEYGVEKAYTVEEDAEKFWRGIDWVHVGYTIDKGTEVKIWMSRAFVDNDMLAALPEALRAQFQVAKDDE